MASRRSYGTGSLFVKPGRGATEVWYGRFWVRGRRVKRRVGPKRAAGSTEGLTRRQAERELRRLIETENRARPTEAVTVAIAGERYIAHLRALGRRRTTLMDYDSYLRVHLAPFFGTTPLEEIDEDDVDALIAYERSEGKAPKSIRNWVGFLHSIFAYAEKRKWTRGNPCKLVDLPAVGGADPDIRFLDQGELEAVLQAVPADSLGPTDWALYLTAAMTGLRQGELLALRWRDIDWSARKIRVRQSYVRGEYGQPKSKRSSRGVPLATRVARELERLFCHSAHQTDDALVFGHPELGRPLDRSKVRKRFRKAVQRAGARPDIRFHDLRHTFGTRMAAAGVPLRTLQEWMGHRDIKTTQIYADYQPGRGEDELVDRAFAPTNSPFPD
jgi:integrase